MGEQKEPQAEADLRGLQAYPLSIVVETRLVGPTLSGSCLYPRVPTQQWTSPFLTLGLAHRCVPCNGHPQV